MDNLNSKKKPYFIKKIYKSDHGTLLGLPKKLSQELELDNETYVRMYYDRENKMVLFTRLPDNRRTNNMPQSIEELINDKMNKLHKIHIAKAMPNALATQIFDKMGKDDIYESKQLIEFVKSF